ncbi:MAG TPA: methylmalonyl-CoA mutase [Candidatus Poseidoniales archaeon]|nr:MAG: methylmalonyl-CoA mutase [Euryarchaeota archaeon]HIG04001.1 methylmalonyl-CoA mutase [Candidatus Poseidoniales archaeon]HIK79029.1 methylmalonyl-CoA mutase [Candidatus Poseidoniales archaeon]
MLALTRKHNRGGVFLRKEKWETLSGIEIPLDLQDAARQSLQADSENTSTENAGQPPYTRGIHSTMYRSRLWTMRQYAGFSSAKQTNERFKLLLDRGQKGLSVAFDLPTQLGMDSDDAMSAGEIGKVGVAIDSVADMQQLFANIPLDKVSTSMTINSPAIILLAMYIVVAEEQGVPQSEIRGTIQNDILKEYIARGTYVFPPNHSMRLIGDIFQYCTNSVPKWNTISISGYHIREAGSTAVQEVAFTLSNALEYVKYAVDAGLEVDSFAPRLSFFFNCHNDFFEEIAKFRAARKLWHDLMTEHFKPTNPKSSMLRFHTQVAGVSLTAQQPLNNIARVTIQALAAVCGGTQSLHTNSFDEALGLPTEKSATVALRTQQVIAEESGAADVVDPLGGSHHVEYLTEKIYSLARSEIEKIDSYGGALKAMEDGYQQRAIHDAAWEHLQQVESGERKIVGVNHGIMDEGEGPETLTLDPAIAQSQLTNLANLKNSRDMEKVKQCLAAVSSCANSEENIFPIIIEAVRNNCTLGEVMNSMKEIFGTYRSPSGF